MNNYIQIIKYILNYKPSLWKELIFSFIGLVLLSILELVGLGILVPIINQLLENGLVNESKINFSIFDYDLTFSSLRYSLFCVCFFIIKFCYLFIFYYYINSTLAKIKTTAQSILLKDINTHGGQLQDMINRAEIIQRFNSDSEYFSGRFLYPFASLVLNTAPVLLIILAMFFVEPYFTFSFLLGISILISIFRSITSKYLFLLAKRQRKFINFSIDRLNERFSGSFDFHQYYAMNWQRKIIKKSLTELNETSASIITINNLNRPFLELIFSIFIIGGIFYVVGLTEIDNKDNFLFIFLSLMKLAPLSGGIVSSLQLIRAGKEIVDRFIGIIKKSYKRQLSSLIKTPDSNAKKASLNSMQNYPFCPTLPELRGRHYPALHLKKGKLLQISANSGWGKSYFLKCLSGSGINIDAVFGLDNGISANVHYVGSQIPLIKGTIKQNVLFGREEKTSQEFKRAFNASQLSEWLTLAEADVRIIDDDSKNLSGGQLQRLGLARAILNPPDLLIIDEATTGLELEMEDNLLDCLLNKYSDMAIIYINHKRIIKRPEAKLLIFEDE